MKEVPQNFGMFTAAGNRRIHTIAAQLSRKVDGLIEKHREGRVPITEFYKLFYQFFRRYREMSYRKGTLEASDTAVRENVWAFAWEVANRDMTGDGYSGKPIMSTDTLDRLWEDADNYVWQQRKLRQQAT